ncbi:hypothetical protein QJQ45_024658 [Haematococcus lacustris]|nr:hypothetical protein QJQ45_024658 [Haematococcus lacustris]
MLLHFMTAALKLCLQIAYIAFLAVLCHGDDTCGLAGDVSNRATEEPGFIDITVPIAAGLPIWSEAHGMPSTFRWLAMDMAKGAFAYDSHFTLGAHVGTHVDSVAHFLPSEYEAGNTIDKVCADPLSWRPHAASFALWWQSKVVVLSLAGALVVAAGQQLGVIGLRQAMPTEIRVAVLVVMAVMLVGVLAQVPLAVLVGPSLVLQVPPGVTDISGVAARQEARAGVLTLTLLRFLTLALPLSRAPLPWPASVLQELNIPSDCQRLLLRTDNTLRSGADHARGGVGIDYLSIGNLADIVGAHLALFTKGIIPVEGLDLTPLQSGRWYHLTCLPLKIQRHHAAAGKDNGEDGAGADQSVSHSSGRSCCCCVVWQGAEGAPARCVAWGPDNAHEQARRPALEVRTSALAPPMPP